MRNNLKTKVINGNEFIIETDDAGNEFIPARSRIETYKKKNPKHSIATTVVIGEFGDKLLAHAEARITDENGKFLGNGNCSRSYQEYQESFTAVAETEAIQRAIALQGYGLTIGIASGEAMRDASALASAGATETLKQKINGGQ